MSHIVHRKLRVLQLIDTFSMGGAEKFVLSLAAKTERQCFEIIPCALFRSGPLEEELKMRAVTSLKKCLLQVQSNFSDRKKRATAFYLSRQQSPDGFPACPHAQFCITTILEIA
jgi:hypothetical protein